MIYKIPYLFKGKGFIFCKGGYIMGRRFSEFDIHTLKNQEMLNKFLTVAPLHHNYALCIDYTKRWFLEKFNDDFFSRNF